MAFDGIVIANLAHDIKSRLEGGKINKIAQPEKDELLFTIKKQPGDLPSVYLSQRQSAPHLFYRYQ